MSVNASLVDSSDSTALGVERYWFGGSGIDNDERILITANPVSAYGTFKSIAFSGPVTTTLVSPNDGGSLIMADLVVTGDKVNSGSVEVRWTDGANTAIIIKPVVTDAPTVVALSFNGRLQGWLDARIDVVVTGVVKGSVLATYAKVPKGLPFSEWDALR